MSAEGEPGLGGACITTPLRSSAFVHPVTSCHRQTILVTPRSLAGVGNIQTSHTGLHLCLLAGASASIAELQQAHKAVSGHVTLAANLADGNAGP